MGLHERLVGLLIFFCLLDTITVALRVFVRTTLSKGAFGWDDVALVVTYVSLQSPGPVLSLATVGIASNMLST